MDTKILIPVDGSTTADRTLEKVIALKERLPGKLTLLHVVDIEKLTYRMIPAFQIDMIRENAGKAGQLVLDDRAARLTAAGFTVQARLEFGSPRQAIGKAENYGGGWLPYRDIHDLHDMPAAKCPPAGMGHQI